MAKSKLDEALNRYIASNLELRAGIFETATYPDGESVAQVAYEQECGNYNTPPRPFFRFTIATKKNDWAALVANGFKYYRGDAVLALSAVGERIADDLRNSLIEWSDPPNAPYTVQKKGFNDPLIDTGEMANSFGYEVLND